MDNNIKLAADAYNLRMAIEAEVVDVEENGIKITIGGDLKIKEISMNGFVDDNLREAINVAIRKIQELQVAKMKEIIGSETLS